MKSTSVYLNIAEFTWEAGRVLRSDPADVVVWLDNFCTALATGKKGLSSLADSLLSEADEYRSKDRERKKLKKEATAEQLAEPPKPEPETPKKTKVEREKREPKDLTSFERFWSAYPKKTGKLDAQKAWSKATAMPPIDQIIDILEHQKESIQWRKDNGQYIPNPSTWLNQGRWADTLPREKSWSDMDREIAETFARERQMQLPKYEALPMLEEIETEY